MVHGADQTFQGSEENLPHPSREIPADLLCRRSFIERLHQTQNHANNALPADGGIHHGVVDRSIRPFDAEILPDEISALAIDGIDPFSLPTESGYPAVE
jgi:hypothetical protein